jgi:hypothetical protein
MPKEERYPKAQRLCHQSRVKVINMNDVSRSPETSPPLHERETPEIADVLQMTLGQQVVADYIGVESAKSIRQLSVGELSLNEHSEARIRDLAELTEAVINIENPQEREQTRRKLISTISKERF